MTTGEAIAEGVAYEPQVIGKIETDIFCAGCHYNLHGLDVLRDSRLDLAIVRCPECGKFHAAGMATGAGRVWLARLASFLILLWMTFLTLFVVAIGFGFFIADAAGIEGFMMGQSNGNIYQRVPYVARSVEMQRELFYMNCMLVGSNILLGWILGAGGAVFLWHRKRIWLVLLCALPMLAVGIAAIIFSTETRYWGPGTTSWAIGRLTTQVLIQCLSILTGILIGRGVARGVLSIVLTRRLLQHLRFLWTVDKKVPPGIDS